MRGAPKVNQQVQQKSGGPIMNIVEVIEPSKDNGNELQVDCVWTDKLGCPYKGRWNAAVLEKAKIVSPKSDA